MRPALAIVVVLCASTAVVRAQGQPQPTTPQPTTPTTSQPPPSPSVDTPIDTASTERLSGVELEGRISDSKPALLGFLGLRVGAPFGQVEQNRLDQLLDKLGYRQLDTRLDVTGPGLVRLHLVLEPVRIVRNLVVKHDWPLFDDEIIRHLSVRTNQALPADAELRGFLDNEAENIRKFLFNEGYFEATVKIEPRLALDWQHVHHHYERKIRSEWIDLLITLDLGSSYKLEGVVATYDHADGPTHLSESRLMEIFGHWLRFKVSQMREDSRKAEKILRDAGYPAARVTCDFVFERDADKKTHRIKLPVRIALKRKVEVHFVGNRAITPAELREQLTIFSAGAYDEVELTESAKAVQREYQKHGYFEAKVTFRRALRRPPVDESGQPKGDEVEDITFTVEEGPELKVRRVELVSESGAPLHIDPAETKSKAELETKPFPTFGAIGLGEGGYVTQLQLSQDADRIATYYKAHGFPLVKVRSEVARDPAAFDALGVFAAEVSGAGGGGDVYVRFYIDEGRKESVGHTEVTFVGPHVKSEFDIFKALKLNMGDPYTEQAEIEDKDRLIALYKTSGHPYVTIDPTKSDWNPTHDRVTLRYIITEGPEVRFGDILVRGNFKTTVFAIRRDLPFKVGDLFDFRKIEAAERNLQTHLIFNVARVEAQFPTEHPVVTSAVPILVTVQERYLEAGGSLTFAIGAASDRLPDYLYLQGSYLWSNVLGIGSQLELKADFAWLAAILHNPITWGASARYTDVRVLGPGWRLDVTGFYRHEDTNRFGLITSYGGSLGLTRNLTPSLRAFIRYDAYLANISVGFLRLLSSNSSTSIPDDTLITKIVSGLVWDHRTGADGSLNPLAPVKGWLLSGTAAYSHPNGTAPTEFVALEGQAIGMLPFHVRQSEFTLMGNVRYSHGFPIGGPALPLVERFYAGGDVSTRGFDTDTLKTEIIRSSPSPLGGQPAFSVIPEGGNIRFLNTIDLQFPIAKTFLGLQLPWDGALFWDMGAIVNGLDQLRWSDFRHSIGISLLRIITPVGPLSVEYAYPLTQTLAEERWKTSPWYTHFPGRIHFNWGIPLGRL